MKPQRGRPTKGDERKDISLQMRITKTMRDKLQYCADRLEKSRTEVIEQGIDIIYKKLKK